jgi:type IV pilus assembly protein PilP
MMNDLCSKSSFLAIALAASVGWMGAWNAASAQPETVSPATDNPVQALETALASGQTPPFVYNRERPDPFFPFLTQEIMKAEAKAKAELTGTQKFEPAQLTLVAIVSGKRGLLAMVQDSSGIGYVLRKGTKIGETGEVIQITPDKVIIEQVKNVTGERTSRKIEMILSKEGEK